MGKTLRKVCFHDAIAIAIAWVAVAVLGMQILGLPAFGATSTGTITGTVHDSTGAVVAGAQVTIANEATGVARVVTSNAQGVYVVSNLDLGHYTLKTTASNFKNYIRTGIVLNLGSTVRADVTLAIGSTQQTVTVQASNVELQSETSDVSTIINGQQISQIPTNGRNLYQLAALVPGVSSRLPQFDSPDAVDLSDSIYMNGDLRRNLYLINGGEEQDGGCTGCMSLAPSQNAIAEAKITTSNAPDDVALASGGYEEFSVKTGTSQLHGQLWEFNRNDDYDANNYFAKLSHTPKPELRYNLFGFNIGGPVYIPKLYEHRNKTFFFLNVEWRKMIDGGEIFQFTMPAQAFSGNFAGLSPIKVPQTQDPAAIARFASFGLTPGEAFPDNSIPAGLIDPNVALMLKTGVIPQPNTPDGQHFSSAAPSTTSVHEEVARIDHKINQVWSLMASMDVENATLTDALAGGGDSYPTTGTGKTSPSYAGQFRLTGAFSSSLLNVTQFNIDELGINEVPIGLFAQPSGFSVPLYFEGVNAMNRLPQVSIGSPYNVMWTTRDLPHSNLYHNDQIEDHVMWLIGKHQFNFGASYMWAMKQQNFGNLTQGNYSFSGQFTGNGFADYLLGFASSYNQSANDLSFHMRTYRVDLYAADNWKVTPRLTLNLGLRWDYIPPAYDINDAMSTFDPSAYDATKAAVFNPDGSLDSSGPGFEYVTGVPRAISNVPFYMNGIALAGRNGTPRGIGGTYHDTFAPHVGFAYSLDPKMVVRGGVGLFYQRLAGNDIYNAASNAPFSATPNASDVYFSSPATSNINGLTAKTPIFPESLWAVDSYFPLPTSLQYNFGVQRQLSPISVVSLAYVGNTLYNQVHGVNINTLPLTDPNRLAVCGRNCGYSGPSYNPNLGRFFPGFAGINHIVSTNLHNTYNSLQASLLVHARKGLNVSVAYTWSHAIDYGSSDEAGMDNPFNFAYDKGNADYDRRNVVQISYFYALPFFLHGNALTRSTIGGWQVSGITTFQSGTPMSANLGYDNLGLGGGTNSRADLVGPISYPKTQSHWFSANSFAAPGPLEFGDSGRNDITMPGLDNWNFALSKTFPLWSEGSNLELRFESFNVFNHTEFSGVNNSFSSGDSFGEVNSTYDPRVLQLGGQITW